MKLKLRKLLPIMFVSVLFSCQQSEVGGESAPGAGEVREFDLQNFSYEDVRELLGSQSIANLRLKDGELAKDVKLLKLNTGVELGEEGVAGTTRFFEGAKEDSLTIIMSETYASFKFQKNGKEFGYLAMGNVNEADAISTDYQTNTVQTRGISSSAISRGLKGSIKLDLSAIADTTGVLGKFGEVEVPEGDNTYAEMDAESSVATRTAYYTSWPRGNTITIHLIRDRSDMPWEHEVDWQVNDLIASLRDIRGDLNVKIWRSTQNFWGSSNASEDLRLFRLRCDDRVGVNYPEATGHDITVLVRHWGWNSGYVGMAHINQYKLSRKNNWWAYAVASTSAWNPRCLAHEVGHVLGAYHVAARPWWQWYLKGDVMTPVASSGNGALHLNSDNRNRIWNNLH